MKTPARIFFFLSILIFECADSQNQPLQFASIFTDNMVLQQQHDVAVWGKAAPGKKIVVESSWKNTASTVADSEGSWSVMLKTVKAGGPYQVAVSDGDTTITLHDVLLGEVWLCSGQSNMEMPLAGWPPVSVLQNSESEISNAKFPVIRFFTVKKAVLDKTRVFVRGRVGGMHAQKRRNLQCRSLLFRKNIVSTIECSNRVDSCKLGRNRD